MVIPARTHEHSLLASATYRTLTSDGRFRRLWMVAALRVAGLKGLNKALTITDLGCGMERMVVGMAMWAGPPSPDVSTEKVSQPEFGR